MNILINQQLIDIIKYISSELLFAFITNPKTKANNLLVGAFYFILFKASPFSPSNPSFSYSAQSSN